MAKKDKNKNNTQWTSEDIDNPVYSKKKPLSIKKQKEIYIDEPRIKSAETFDKAAKIAFDIARLHPTYGIGMNLIDAANALKNKDFDDYMSNVTGGMAKATYNASKFNPKVKFDYKKLRNKLGNSVLGGMGILMGAQDYILDAKQLYDDVSSIKFKNGGVIRLRQNRLACGGKRKQAFLGAIIGAVGSIAGGVINAISSNKQRKQQEKLQEEQRRLKEDNSLTESYSTNAELQKEYQLRQNMEYKAGGKDAVKPIITKGGTAVPLGNNLSLLRGRSHNTGGIIIGTGKNSIEAEGNEVVQNTGDELRIFSAQPMINGYSPAELVAKGYNPNEVFNVQEKFKDVNNLNDDGTKKAKFGKNKKIIKNKINMNTYKCGGRKRLKNGGRQSLDTAIGADQFEQFKKGMKQIRVGSLDNIPIPSQSTMPNLSIKDNISNKGADIPSRNKNKKENKTFSQAFAEARKAGKREFTWNGKRYGTLYKEEVKNTNNNNTNNNTNIPQTNITNTSYNYAEDIITPSLLRKRENLMTAASRYIEQYNKRNNNGTSKKITRPLQTNDSITNIPQDTLNLTNNQFITESDTIPSIKPKTQNLQQNRPNSKSKKSTINNNIRVTTKFSELPNGSVTATIGGKNYYFPTVEDRDNFLNKVYSAINNNNNNNNDGSFADYFRNNIRNIYDRQNESLERLRKQKERRRLFKCGGKRKAKLGLTINSDDWISAGIGALGSVASGIAGLVSTNNMEAPKKPTQYQAAKLKTTYNISPQIEEVNRSRERQLDDVSSNTASSVARLARRNRINTDASDAINKLYGEKENIETQLINQDRLNSQQVRNRNIETYNQYLSDLTEFNNQKRASRVNAINNMIGGITSAAGDLITTGQQRYQDEQAISAITGSNERNNIKYLMDAGYKPSKTQLEAAIASATNDEEKEFYTNAYNQLYPKRKRLRRTTPISENNFGIDLNDTSSWLAN